MQRLDSFLGGAWRPGTGDPFVLFDPSTEVPLHEGRSATGLGEALTHAREVGGPAIAGLSFARRGECLAALAKAVFAAREELIAIAVQNGGNTRSDAKFDIDGGTAVLAAYAELATGLGEQPWILDGEAVPLLRGGKLKAQHVLQARRGVAVHVNAFNFPAWGLLGKLAPAFLAGMPVLAKPATSSAALAHRIVALAVEAAVLPTGALSLLVGPAGDLLDHLGPMDVVAFTGSAATAATIRGHRRVIEHNVRVNVEADSLNAVVFGADVEPGSELWDLALRDAVIELTQKAGQKCTATRRILVPIERLDQVRDALLDRLAAIAAKVGNPVDDSVRMGPLATEGQLADARRGVARLREHARLVVGDPERRSFSGVADGCGWFLEPIVLEATPEAVQRPEAAFHELEVFGPVATLLPYDGTLEQAARAVSLGRGSLVCTLYTDDRDTAVAAVSAIGPSVGRLVVADDKVAGASMSPGCVFPQVVHGGPGRAGGGSELGGRHGLELYLQRTTIQGGAAQLSRMLGRDDAR